MENFNAPGILGAGSTTELIIGRQTVSIGSKRQIERVDYANVIRSFTGLHGISRNPRGDELHGLFVALVERRPTDRVDRENNALVANQEQWNRRIWGLHYRRANLVPRIVEGLWGEVFAYGLNEEDRIDDPTPNRQYVTPGFRLFRAPMRGRWDADIEGSLRLGQRRATQSTG